MHMAIIMIRDNMYIYHIRMEKRLIHRMMMVLLMIKIIILLALHLLKFLKH